MKKRENAILTRVDDYVLTRLNEIVGTSKDLDLAKSECVYAILKAFFKVNQPPKDFERVREIIIKMRKGYF